MAVCVSLGDSMSDKDKPRDNGLPKGKIPTSNPSSNNRDGKTIYGNSNSNKGDGKSPGPGKQTLRGKEK
jgi:hypothetical protein